MKTVHCWNDLLPFGIDPLTGEACGFGYRILFDLTAKGKRALEKCLGASNLNLPSPWNRGSKEDPHVACVMLTQDMLTPLAVFALLEHGCAEVWLFRSGGVLGVEVDDDPAQTQAGRKHHGDSVARVFRQGPTRNTHRMTGRAE